MNFKSCYAQNGEIKIHYFDSIEQADCKLTPVIICPGLSEIAEEYIELMQFLLPRRSIVLSFRGRGQSDTPLSGYDLFAHISDIESVVQATGLKYFHLFSYSRGVSYALGYSRKHADHVNSIIAIDYPFQHLAMSTDWPSDYIDNYLIPEKRIDINIRKTAVLGIQRESKLEDLSFQFDKPALVIRGKLEESLITDESLHIYKRNFTHLTVVECEDSGHDVRSAEQEKVFNAIKNFLNDID